MLVSRFERLAFGCTRETGSVTNQEAIPELVVINQRVLVIKRWPPLMYQEYAEGIMAFCTGQDGILVRT